MVEIIKEYKIEGNYLREGLEGFQEGEISYLSNNFFVGYISDRNSIDLPFGPKKVLLGIHFPEKDEVGLLKISILKNLLPISWWLKSDNQKKSEDFLGCSGITAHLKCAVLLDSRHKNLNNGFSESYSGYWLPHSIFSPAINSFKELPSIEDLLKIDFDSVKNTYFKQEDFEEIKDKQSELEIQNKGKIKFM